MPVHMHVINYWQKNYHSLMNKICWRQSFLLTARKTCVAVLIFVRINGCLLQDKKKISYMYICLFIYRGQLIALTCYRKKVAKLCSRRKKEIKNKRNKQTRKKREHSHDYRNWTRTTQMIYAHCHKTRPQSHLRMSITFIHS